MAWKPGESVPRPKLLQGVTKLEKNTPGCLMILMATQRYMI